MSRIKLFCGEDSIKRDAEVEKALKAVLGSKVSDPYSQETIFCDSMPESECIEKIYSAAMSGSLFAEQKVVILQNLQECSKDLNEQLFKILNQEELAADLFLIFNLNSKELPARTYLKLQPEIYEFELPKSYNFHKWIQERAHHYHFKLNKHEAEFFQEMIGVNPNAVDAELRKLAEVLPQGKELTLSILQRALSSQREFVPWEMNNSFGLKQSHEFFTLLQSNLQGGSSPIAIVANLYKHTQSLIGIQSFLIERLDPEAIAKNLRMHPYVFQQNKLIDQAKVRRGAELARIVIRLVEIDQQLKNGQITNNTDFERAIIEIFGESR